MTNPVKIPLLITIDLEIAHDHDIGEQKRILLRLNEDFKKRNLPVTVFSTADALTEFADEAKVLLASGNEFGLHGSSHTAEENYNRMPFVESMELIKAATGKFESILSVRPRSFRGPFMTTSASTHRALLQNGYTADFSVCPQRVDFFNATGFNREWLLAPRRPYLPSPASPFKPGSVPLVMVPLSGFMIPFVSGMLYLWGLRCMRIFFGLLRLEATIRQQPIVYLFHSYEFCSFRRDARQKWLHRLYRQNREERYRMNLQLIDHMIADPRLQPMTAQDCIVKFNGNRKG